MQVPASFYGGEAFRMDLSPLVNFMAKRQAAQQAKEAALDKYYKGLTKNATSTGVRGQDQEILKAALDNYSNFYIKNSDAITSGRNPELAMEAERLAKVPFEIIAKSKDAGATDKMVATIRGSNPEISKRWTKATWDNYTKSTAPTHVLDANGNVVENPNYQDFDPMMIQLNPKEVDLVKQWDDAGKGIEVAQSTTKEKDDISPDFYTKVTITEAPTINGLKQVASKADSQWNDETEYTFGKDKTFDQFKLSDPTKFNELQASYSKVFGNKPIENDKDLYIATAINLADKTKITKQDRVRDDVKWSNWNRAQNLAASKQLSVFNKSLNAKQIADQNKVSTAFETILDGTYGAAVKKGNKWYDKNGNLLNTKEDKPLHITGQIPNDIASFASEKMRPYVDYLDLYIKDGVVQGVYNEFTNLITRGNAVNKTLKASGQKPSVPTMNNSAPATNSLGF